MTRTHADAAEGNDQARLGQYRIESVLEADELTVLFAARGRRRCAVRVLAAELQADAQARASFMARAELASCHTDVGLVPTLDHGREWGTVYAVEPHPEGYPCEKMLESFADERRGLPALIVSGMSLAIARAMEVVHYSEGSGHTQAEDRIHGAIHPANLRIRASGRPLLTGFVRPTGPHGLSYRPPEWPVRFFLAPELLAEERPGPHTDVYGAGLTMLCLATGYDPRQVEGRPAAAAVIPDLLARAARGLPDYLVEILECAVQLDPAARYSSAAALRRALARPGEPDEFDWTAWLAERARQRVRTGEQLGEAEGLLASETVAWLQRAVDEETEADAESGASEDLALEPATEAAPLAEAAETTQEVVTESKAESKEERPIVIEPLPSQPQPDPLQCERDLISIEWEEQPVRVSTLTEDDLPTDEVARSASPELEDLPLPPEAPPAPTKGEDSPEPAPRVRSEVARRLPVAPPAVTAPRPAKPAPQPVAAVAPAPQPGVRRSGAPQSLDLAGAFVAVLAAMAIVAAAPALLATDAFGPSAPTHATAGPVAESSAAPAPRHVEPVAAPSGRPNAAPQSVAAGPPPAAQPVSASPPSPGSGEAAPAGTVEPGLDPVDAAVARAAGVERALGEPARVVEPVPVPVPASVAAPPVAAADRGSARAAPPAVEAASPAAPAGGEGAEPATAAAVGGGVQSVSASPASVAILTDQAALGEAPVEGVSAEVAVLDIVQVEAGATRTYVTFRMTGPDIRPTLALDRKGPSGGPRFVIQLRDTRNGLGFTQLPVDSPLVQSVTVLERGGRVTIYIDAPATSETVFELSGAGGAYMVTARQG